METTEPILISLRGRGGKLQGYAMIDELDVERIRQYLWYLTEQGYAARGGGYDGAYPVLMHRELLGLVQGDGIEGDHINGNRLDNRRTNLRSLTKKENLQNKHLSARASKGCSSKYRGVHFYSASQKWIARPTLDGKHHFLGSFGTEDEAALVVQEWRRVHVPHGFEGMADPVDVGSMKAVYCSGVRIVGNKGEEPCRKFLGLLTLPFDQVLCPRCKHVNRSEDAPTAESCQASD